MGRRRHRQRRHGVWSPETARTSASISVVAVGVACRRIGRRIVVEYVRRVTRRSLQRRNAARMAPGTLLVCPWQTLEDRVRADRRDRYGDAPRKQVPALSADAASNSGEAPANVSAKDWEESYSHTKSATFLVNRIKAPPYSRSRIPQPVQFPSVPLPSAYSLVSIVAESCPRRTPAEAPIFQWTSPLNARLIRRLQWSFPGLCRRPDLGHFVLALLAVH